MMPPRLRRSAADRVPDIEVWDAVARSVTPLKGRRHRAQPRPATPASKPTLRPELAQEPAKSRPAAHTPAVAASKAAPKPPALAPLAKRARKKLAGGALAIDARIDLHGMTQSEAHAALLRFLRRAQVNEARYVLVITGKGARGGGEGRGVLKRQVPLWLALPEFRPYVVGYEDAHIAHGGEGALYLHVRRAR